MDMRNGSVASRRLHSFKNRPALFEEAPDFRGSVNVVIDVAPEVFIEAQAKLLDFPAERNVFTEPEMKIDQESRLTGHSEGIGLHDKLLLPFRMRQHGKRDFLDETAFGETVLAGLQLGFHRSAETSEDDAPGDVGIPLRLKIECFKTLGRIQQNPKRRPNRFAWVLFRQSVSTSRRTRALLLLRGTPAAVDDKTPTTRIHWQKIEVDVIVVFS